MKAKLSDNFWKVKKNETTPEPSFRIFDPCILVAVESARGALGFEYFITGYNFTYRFVHVGLASHCQTAYDRVYENFVGKYRIEKADGYEGCVKIELEPGVDDYEPDDIITEWRNLPRVLHDMVKGRLETLRKVALDTITAAAERRAEITNIIDRLLVGTPMHCSEVGQSGDAWEFHTAESLGLNLVGILQVTSFDPPQKDEVTDDVYTHQYKWVPSGETVCTSNLEASLKRTLEAQWKRHKYKQEKGDPK